ncbi:hypothetical protein [Kitasatospora sp. NPDC002522]
MNGPARAAETVGELKARLREELAALGVDADPPIDVVLPQQVERGVRQLTATISVDYATVVEKLPVQRTRSGVLVGDPAVAGFHGGGTALTALDHLPRRDDTFVVAMHVGAAGAPVTAKQLADVLLASYDLGLFDGKTRIDFLSCRLGGMAGRGLSEALAVLWAHQAANPRPGVAGPLVGRAPVGDVWVVPKLVGGVTQWSAAPEVVVADHVGVDSQGRPVVVQSDTSFWRTFTDSGDAAHTAETAAEHGGLLTAGGTVEDAAPTGYRSEHVSDPDAHTPASHIPGTVRFGPGPQGPAFHAGAGRQGRDLHSLQASGFRLETDPVSPQAGGRPTGRAFLSRAGFGKDEPGGGTGPVLGDIRAETTHYRHVLSEDGVSASAPNRIKVDLGRRPAPWAGGEQPFFVMAEMSGHRVRLAAQGGGDAEVEPHDFAAVLAADPVLASLHPDAPIVLTISESGGSDLELARDVAAATDRVVYMPATVTDEAGRQVPGPRGPFVRIDPPSSGGVEPKPPLHTTSIPAGVWVGGANLPEAAARTYAQTLDHLPHRDDTYVVAMHIGDNGAPISPEQLADVLRAAHDSGKLDGKTRIDFLSCRLGAPTERHVPAALTALWAHQQANPRPGVSGPLTGRAPVGDVWVTPKIVNGEADFTTHREVIVADHVGVDAQGRPVVVQSDTSFWRTFTDSGDAGHTAVVTEGPVVGQLPDGYEVGSAAALRPLDGAVKFGTPEAGQAVREADPADGRDVGVDHTADSDDDFVFFPSEPEWIDYSVLGDGREVVLPPTTDEDVDPDPTAWQLSQLALRGLARGELFGGGDGYLGAVLAVLREHGTAGDHDVQSLRYELASAANTFFNTPDDSLGAHFATPEERAVLLTTLMTPGRWNTDLDWVASELLAAPPYLLDIAVVYSNGYVWPDMSATGSNLTPVHLVSLAGPQGSVELSRPGHPRLVSPAEVARQLRLGEPVEGSQHQDDNATGDWATVLSAPQIRDDPAILGLVADLGHDLALAAAERLSLHSRTLSSDQQRYQLLDGGALRPSNRPQDVRDAGVFSYNIALDVELRRRRGDLQVRADEVGDRPGESSVSLREAAVVLSALSQARSAATRARWQVLDEPSYREVRDLERQIEDAYPVLRAARLFPSDDLLQRFVHDTDLTRPLKALAARFHDHVTLALDTVRSQVGTVVWKSSVLVVLDDLRRGDWGPRFGSGRDWRDRAPATAARAVAYRARALAAGSTVSPQVEAALKLLDRDALSDAKSEVNWRHRLSTAAAVLTRLDQGAGIDPEHSSLRRLTDLGRQAGLVQPRRQTLEWHAQGPSFTSEPDAFVAAVEAARAGTDHKVPYLEADGVLTSAGEPIDGRPIGVELTITFPDGTPQAERDRRLAAMMDDFVRSGLSTTTKLHTANDIVAEGYTEQFDGWRFEDEIGVAAELISPVMYDTKQHWENIRKACEIITRHGGIAPGGTGGGHINIGTGDFGFESTLYSDAVEVFRDHEDAFYRLAQDPSHPTHRGVRACRPNEAPPPGGFATLAEARNPNRGRYWGLNLLNIDGRTSARAEFRLWGATLDPGTLQAHIRVSKALIDLVAAHRDLGLPLPRTPREAVGSHFAKVGTGEDLHGQALIDDSTSVRRMIDLLGKDAAGKEQLAALFALTRWQDDLTQLPTAKFRTSAPSQSTDLPPATTTQPVAIDNSGRPRVVAAADPAPQGPADSPSRRDDQAPDATASMSTFLQRAETYLRQQAGSTVQAVDAARRSDLAAVILFAEGGVRLHQLIPLRDGKWEERLARGLRELPEVTGPVHRTAPLTQAEVARYRAAAADRSALPTGDPLWAGPVVGRERTGPASAQETRFVVSPLTARRAGALLAPDQGPHADVVVFAPGARFRVTEVRALDDGTTEIHVAELPRPTAPPSGTRGVDASAAGGARGRTRPGRAANPAGRPAPPARLRQDRAAVSPPAPVLAVAPASLGETGRTRQVLVRLARTQRLVGPEASDRAALDTLAASVPQLSALPQAERRERLTSAGQVLRTLLGREPRVADLAAGLALTELVRSAHRGRYPMAESLDRLTRDVLGLPGDHRVSRIEREVLFGPARLLVAHDRPVTVEHLRGVRGMHELARRRFGASGPFDRAALDRTSRLLLRIPGDGPLTRGERQSALDLAARTTSVDGPPELAGPDRGGERVQAMVSELLTEHGPVDGPPEPAGPDRGGERVQAMVSELLTQHGPGARFLGDASGKHAAAVSRFPVDERFFTVAAHTAADGMPVWHGAPVTPDELASVLVELHARGEWDGVRPLQLPACDLGAGGESSYAAQVLTALREKLPHLDLEAYAPNGTLWFVPPLSPAGVALGWGPGHLVVATPRGVGFDSSGRLAVQEGGHWLRLRLPAGESDIQVESLGAHLPVDGALPASADRPEGYHRLNGELAGSLAPAVPFGDADDGSAEGVPRPGDPVHSPEPRFFEGEGTEDRDLHEVPGSGELVQSRALGPQGGPRATGRAYLDPEGFEDLDEMLAEFRAGVADYRHLLVDQDRDPEDPAYVRQDLGRFAVPWAGGPEPYFVLAGLDGGEVPMTDSYGDLANVRADEFAAMVVSDPALRELPADVPVVLAISHAGSGGLDLPRRIAAGLDAAGTPRTVYALTAEADMAPVADSGWSLGLKAPYLTVDGTEAPHGRILRIDPPSKGGVDPALGGPAGHVVTADGTRLTDSSVHTTTVADADGRPIGRVSLGDHEWHLREPTFRPLRNLAWFENRNGEFEPTGLFHPVPWNPGNAYFFGAHAGREGFSLESAHGDVSPIGGAELGGFLKRRPSVAALRKSVADGALASIVLLSCESAEHAQAVADATGLVVYAPNARVGVAPAEADDGSESPTIYVEQTQAGSWGAFLTFHPRARASEGGQDEAAAETTDDGAVSTDGRLVLPSHDWSAWDVPDFAVRR